MKRGFTLLEVLLVITLIGVFFGVLSYSFYSSVRNSYLLLESAELTKEEALLFWNLQKKLVGAVDLYMRKDALFVITSSGDYYEGVVKCAYLYKDGWLYYYEFPYPYGEITFYEEDRLIKLGRFDEFSFRVYANGQYLEEFRGIPQWVEVRLGGRSLKLSL
ncbi:MAG: type II secretion system protein [Aquificaceae bacterium]|jgi:prepilin-type N-terminal cleavage/methylation domain-containing protein|uniref:type II secretion system protein n=1 Tax=Hydrogenobacter sp. Uz 6-8 TaxID=3384828 RepID=UPI0030B05076